MSTSGKTNRGLLRSKENLTRVQEKALVAMLTEPTVRKAAERLGIGERRMYRIIADPHFRAEYERRRSAAMELECSAAKPWVREDYNDLHALGAAGVERLIAVLANEIIPKLKRISFAADWLKKSKSRATPCHCKPVSTTAKRAVSTSKGIKRLRKCSHCGVEWWTLETLLSEEEMSAEKVHLMNKRLANKRQGKLLTQAMQLIDDAKSISTSQEGDQ